MRKKTNEEFLEEVEKLPYDKKYKMLEEYKGSKMKIKALYKPDNKVVTIYSNHFLQGYEPSSVGYKKSAKTKNNNGRNRFEKYIKTRSDIEILEDYINCNSKIKTRCLLCGYIWYPLTKDIVNSHIGCPKCRKSKGERKICEILDKNNIIYETEKSFIWSNRKRYDFYLPCYNLLIEYDGKQHFIKTMYSNDLESVKENDKIKTKMATDNYYNILRISFKDYKNIEEIILSAISCFGGNENAR